MALSILTGEPTAVQVEVQADFKLATCNPRFRLSTSRHVDRAPTPEVTCVFARPVSTNYLSASGGRGVPTHFPIDALTIW